jgi:hypothetical protein
MRNRHSLVNKMFRNHFVEYDSKFVLIAIQNDAFDIVFLLRDIFPQSFTHNEGEFTEVIITSFTKSNTCWLAKCFMFKSII